MMMIINKMKPAILSMATIFMFLMPVALLAQQPVKAKPVESTQVRNDEMTQLLDFSRPGKFHALLGKLQGAWTFQDARLAFVKGTLIRKSIYNGRFYTVEMSGGKLMVPVADGQMKEEIYQSMQLEGYDNPSMKFTTTSINNHIGSDIQVQTGTYDAAKNEFTYTWTDELIRGQKQINKRIVKMTDADHYTKTYYEQKGGKDVQVRVLNYTKAKE